MDSRAFLPLYGEIPGWHIAEKRLDNAGSLAAAPRRVGSVKRMRTACQANPSDRDTHKLRRHMTISRAARILIAACSLWTATWQVAVGSPGTNSNRLLVVAPEQFHEALQDFIAYKQTSMSAELLSLENILKAGKGADDPEKLKRFLFKEWRAKGVGYVLLVGDVDVLPVRFMVLDRVTPAAFDYSFYPSDLYYGDLAKVDGSFEDWNGCKEGFHAGYFGEVRGEKNKQDPINFDAVDYRPEIAFGRWPVSTPEEVRLVAAKTVSYERAVLGGQTPELKRAALLAVGGWVDSRPLLQSLAAKLAKSWTLEKRFYGDDGRTLPPSHEEVCGLLNRGVGLVVHTGHGQPDAWEQCFSVRDLDTITNSAILPVVISAGCSTAYFAPLPPYGAYLDVNGGKHKGTDHQEVFKEPPPPPAPYQTGRFNPTGLGEQMLKRNGNGCVAYIGCNTGSQPCALTLVEGFVNALATDDSPRLGDCWASAIRHYYEKENLATLKPNDDWYPPSIFFQGMKFMLFGDPSLRLPVNGKGSR
jgi:peptidase C25-like protein